MPPISRPDNQYGLSSGTGQPWRPAGSMALASAIAAFVSNH